MGGIGSHRLNPGWPVLAGGAAMLTGAALGLLLTTSGTATLADARPQGPTGPALDDLWFILGTNLRVAAQMLAGVLSLGLHATFHLGFIGFGLARLICQAQGVVPAAAIAASVVPHAVLELPAFVLLGSIQFEALRLAHRTFKRQMTIDRDAVAPLIRRTAAAIALLVLAAMVEVLVSGRAGELIR